MAAQPREEYERIQKAFLKVLPNPMTQAQQINKGVQRIASKDTSGQVVRENPAETALALYGGYSMLKSTASTLVSEGFMTKSEAQPVIKLADDSMAQFEKVQFADDLVQAENAGYFGDTNVMRTSSANTEAALSDAKGFTYSGSGDKATGFKEAGFNPMLDKATPATKQEAADFLKNTGGTITKHVETSLLREVAHLVVVPISIMLTPIIYGIFSNKEASLALYQDWYNKGIINQQQFYSDVDTLNYGPDEKANLKLAGDVTAMPLIAKRAADKIATANVPEQYRAEKAKLGFTPDQITQKYQQEAEAAQNQPTPGLGQPPQGATNDYLSQAAKAMNMINNVGPQYIKNNTPTKGALDVGQTVAQNILPPNQAATAVKDRAQSQALIPPQPQQPIAPLLAQSQLTPQQQFDELTKKKKRSI
jgi:hypothetical protein